MILKALTGTAGPYIIGAVVVGFLALLGTIGYLWDSRDRAVQEAAKLDQANAQFAQTIREQAMDNSSLRAEIKRRDAVVASAVKARQLAESRARATQEQLQEALKDDECAQTAHPSAVADSLRRESGRSDQD